MVGLVKEELFLHWIAESENELRTQILIRHNNEIVFTDIKGGLKAQMLITMKRD